jgi:hypothetical protein
MDYLTDDHDSKRLAQVAAAELDYMARSNPGFKTNLEGGKIALNGYGQCEGMTEAEMRKHFAETCIPKHRDSLGRKTTATTGYQSHTLTLPKELSLLAETNPKAAKEAISRAVKETLENAFPGKSLAAVSAVHTRNVNGEIHYHAHVLVAKFCVDIESGKVHSINQAKMGGGFNGNRIKESWMPAINREMERALKIRIENRKDGKPIIHLPDGSTLAPLNRVSRREMEIRIAPNVINIGKDGKEYSRPFTLNKMDQKIFEVISRNRGRSGWSRDSFLNAFPKESIRIGRYESRLKTLQEIGYISANGKVTDAFKAHAEVKWGNDSPQLAQIRMDIENEAKSSNNSALNVPAGSYLQKTLSENPNIGPRIEALGLSLKDIHKAESTWQEQRPRNTKALMEWANAEKELIIVKKNESAELSTVSSISARLDIKDRYAKERQAINAKIAALRPAAEKSLRHPDFRMTQEKFSDIQQDEKVLARIELRIHGLESSRADKLEKADTKQAADKINRWHDSRIRPLEMTQQKLADQVHQKRERLLDASEIPIKDHANRFKEKSRYSLAGKPSDRRPQLGQSTQAGQPRDYSRQVADQALHRVTGHMQGLVKLVRGALELRDQINQMKQRIPAEKIQDLRRGVDVLTKAGRPDGRLLEPWRGKETELAARIGLTTTAAAGRVGIDQGKAEFRNAPLPLPPRALSKGIYESAKEAGKIGTQMNKADKILGTNPTPVPGCLRRLGPQIQRVNARAEAMGLRIPLTKDVLDAISAKELAGVFKEDKALETLSSVGDTWGVLKSQVVQASMRNLTKVANIALETGQGLTKSLPFGR